MIRLKRAYEEPSKDDGERILVDRLWPRGLSKQRAKIDLWMKEIAPSTELRKWFGHDPKRWKEFSKRFLAELKGKKELVQELRKRARKGTVTLVYAARDEEHNEALILKKLLSSRP